MPKDDDNREITPGEARKLIVGHQKEHGRDMTDKIPPGSKWGTHDAPSQAELDEDPDWFKQGKKFADLPDDFSDDD